ncbi:MAG: DUF1801 domain-containing protein [Phycisphaerae bacterium]|nr:DUF1801 domain-containing protein [Phycisphaerae bacterium]
MKAKRLSADRIAECLARFPGESQDLMLELRDLVLETVPEAIESIKFNSLCYHKPDHPYGAIGGNICLVSGDQECAILGFIHGAFLPDPEGLLIGTAKAKRHVEIRSSREIRRPAIRDLIRAAVEFTPVSEDKAD